MGEWRPQLTGSRHVMFAPARWVAALRGNRAELIAHALSWAAGRGISYAVALDSLVPADRDADPAAPPGYRSHRPGSGFNRCLLAAATDLHAGYGLGDTLKRRLGRYLPADFVRAVAAADRAGLLGDVLPRLAPQVRDLPGGLGTALAQLLPLAVYLLVPTALMGGLATFILPKYARMMEGLTAGEATTWLLHWVAQPGVLWVPAWYMLLTVGVGFFLLLALAPTHLGRCIQDCFLWVPLFGTYARDCRRLELARSLALALGAGRNFLDAADYVLAVTPSPWIEDRLGRLVNGIAAGQPWEQAWLDHHIGSPLDDWLILNSARREQPAEGFRLMAECLTERILRFERMAAEVLGVAATLFLAAMVVVVVYVMVTPLIFLDSAIAGG